MPFKPMTLEQYRASDLETMARAVAAGELSPKQLIETVPAMCGAIGDRLPPLVAATISGTEP